MCLDKLPKSQQRAAQLLLCAMPYAHTRAESARLRDGFARRHRASYPEAVRILEQDWETLTTFHDFPAEHWKHLRTSNVVESPFAALRLRTGAARRFKVVANATMLIWRVLRVVERRFPQNWMRRTCSPTSTQEGSSRTASPSPARSGRKPA